MSVKVSLKDLLESGAHFGHQASRWNPKMDEYIHGIQDGVHVFDLIKTKEKLEEALDALEKASADGKKILIIGTKKQARERVQEIAKEADVAFVVERWLGGTITNFEQIKKSLKKLSDMKEKREAGEYKSFTKKERGLIDREIDRLERFFGGMATLEDIPDVLFIVDSKKEAGAIKEAKVEGIETIAIVDSNSDPNEVDYPIPMNDDAAKSLHYVLDLVKEAILKGKGKKKTK